MCQAIRSLQTIFGPLTVCTVLCMKMQLLGSCRPLLGVEATRERLPDPWEVQGSLPRRSSQDLVLSQPLEQKGGYFPSRDMQVGVIFPRILKPPQPWQCGPLSGLCFLPENTRSWSKRMRRMRRALPMAVLFGFLLFLCGHCRAAVGKEREVGESSATCKVGEGAWSSSLGA